MEVNCLHYARFIPYGHTVNGGGKFAGGTVRTCQTRKSY